MTWTVERSRTVIDDAPWLTIREQACRTESGHLIDPFYLLDYPDWVNVVALTEDDRLVMVRQYRHGVERVGLEVPGGVIDATDVTPEAAARRELREETGFEARHWRLISRLSPNAATHTNTTFCFLATDAHPAADPQLEAGEELETILLPVAEVVRAAQNGEVVQSLHVAGLLLSLAASGHLAAVG